MSPNKFCVALGTFLLISAASQAKAEIKKSAKDGFQIEVSFSTPLQADKAYSAFIKDFNRWWDASHSYSGKSENLSIDLKQQAMLEKLPHGGFVRHMNVVLLQPDRMIRMTGGLGPLQAMGVSGAMTVSFGKDRAGKTMVQLSYHVTGSSTQELDKFAGPVNKVLSGQMTRFEHFCKSKHRQLEKSQGSASKQQPIK